MSETEAMPLDESSFYIGLGLAISSCIFIGASFIIKKLALIRLTKNGKVRASSGGYGYLKDWLWWTGLLTMGVGELANFAAYAFAPASLVTPLGALSVIVAAVLASKYLKERLNLLGKIGCLLCILGSTVIVIHAPKERPFESFDQLVSMIKEPLFLIYISFVCFTSFLLIAIYAPKYGNKYVIINILICSLIGSLSVMSVKGLGLGIRESLGQNGKNQLANVFFWVICVSVVVTVSIQMIYLNKALDIFDTSVVTPIYYVFFTSFVILASSILFKEFQKMDFQDILGTLLGFIIVIIAIFLLNAFKDFNITLEKLKNKWLAQKNKLENGPCEIESRMLIADLKSDMSPGLITWTIADDEF